MRTTTGRRGALALVLASGLIAAGCGDDETTDGSVNVGTVSDAAAGALTDQVSPDTNSESADQPSTPPEDVAATLFQGFADGDATAICDNLSAASAQQAADDEDADSCEEGVEATYDSGGAQDTQDASADVEVGKVKISGDTATVELSTPEGNGGTADLVLEDGEWKVDL